MRYWIPCKDIIYALVWGIVDKIEYICIDGGAGMINPCDEILEGEARYSIVKADGTPITSIEDLANCKIALITNVIEAGTPVNRDTLLDMLDFTTKNTIIDGANNTITETDGTVTKITTFGSNSITEVLSGGSNIIHTKVTEFNNGSIVETLTETTLGGI